jgi:hypothetical protein
MITEIEKEQLDRIAYDEQDFYAEVLFLALFRRASSGEPEATKRIMALSIADTVLSVFTDINERTGDGGDDS